MSSNLFRLRVQRFTEGLFGGRVCFNRGRMHASRDMADLAAAGRRLATIFDVGANVGQSAERFIAHFPDAKIFCFEPMGKSAAQLEHNVRAFPNVRCFRAACGARLGEAILYSSGSSLTSTLVPEAESFQPVETVPVTTVDATAGKLGLDRIDLLKIDAEGFDLEVLKGASTLLARKRIGAVLAEVGFGRDDHRHVLFDEVRDFLAGYGYSLFGIYGQQLEWNGDPRLRFANALFTDFAPYATETLKAGQRPVADPPVAAPLKLS